MPIKPLQFEFKTATFDPATRKAYFSYGVHFENRESLCFVEQLQLPADHPVTGDATSELTSRILQGLHLILGISYYKLYVPREIKLPYQLTKEQAEFWTTVYRKGLGEFCFRNNLDPKHLAVFPASASQATKPVVAPRKNRVLLGIGGGKDSIVAAELLRQQKFEVSSLVTQTQRANPTTDKLTEALKFPRLTVERTLDPQIFKVHPESYNGHIPISAIFAWIGTLVAALYDYRYAVVANEYSSNFGNIEYHGETVNHQWSKSQEFESMFQEYIRNYITGDITYFSLVRPFHELRIAKMFTKYPKYFPLFSSCNQVAKINSSDVPRSTSNAQRLWCGQCAKCAFAFTMFAAHLSKKEVLKIFGVNMFADAKLLPLFADILGFGTMKPFDCVGTFDETQAALALAQKKFKKDLVVKTFAGKIKDSKKLIASVLKTNPAPTLPTPFIFSGLESALILGYGREGKVTKQWLKKYHPKVKVSIADRAKDKNYLAKQESADLVIKTPGVPKQLVTAHYTTATNLFFAQIDQTKNKIIGITGSKGKSTTSTLIYEIIKASGKPVEFLGNIGGPMLAATLKPIKAGTIFVLELSSYQLDDLRYSPHISVVTNLFPEHMTYHGSLQNYYSAKKNIIARQSANDVFVYNQNTVDLKTWAGEAHAQTLPFIEALPVSDEQIPLIGRHNRENVKAAVTVARLLGIPDEVTVKAIKNFKALPHRLQNIGTYNGITFYDDAISTAPESTIEALESLSNVSTLFLGGEDRGYNFTTLEVAVRKHNIKNVVLFPETGNRMFKDAAGLKVLKTKSMKEAVAFAYKNSPQGSICLLSTASPSYSLWKDFIEKGNEFQKYVRQLGKK